MAPQAKNNRFAFGPLKTAADFRLDYDVTILPPKKYMLPQTESLLSFEVGGAFQSVEDAQELVLLGVHPYDLVAIGQMDELFIHLPFRSFLVPYANVRSVRPDALFRIFPPGEQSGWQRNVMSGVWSRTVVVVELNEFPWPRGQLRTWGGKYLLLPHEPGLVLPVQDWMALRTELDDRYAAWRLRQRPEKRPKYPFWMT